MHTPPKARLNTRQNEILNHVRVQGAVQVDPLAEAFAVTPQTIRRDLNLLCQLRLLQRVHGGAIAHDGVSNLGYNSRKRLAAEEKAAIGREAATLISDDTSLFINIGTTTEQVARHLTHHVGLLVISNSINVVSTLLPCETIDLMITGGVVRREDGGIVGDASVDFIRQFKVDYAVIGASAIEEDGTILDYDAREVRIAQEIIANARAVILVADAMKFERSAPIRIASVTQLDYFVTDSQPPARFTQICEEAGVVLVVTSEQQPETAIENRIDKM